MQQLTSLFLFERVMNDERKIKHSLNIAQCAGLLHSQQGPSSVNVYSSGAGGASERGSASNLNINPGSVMNMGGGPGSVFHVSRIRYCRTKEL